jgi:putative transcriptional regulator
MGDTSFAGHFLVASPQLADANFLRTVVLLIHHNQEGAFGVVLNRMTDSTIKDLWQEVAETPCPIDRHINLGGPVSGPLMAIHTDPALGEIQIIPGLYFAAQREHLEQLIGRGEERMRLFVGHSGWGQGQLEHEMAEGSWLTTPANVDDVFASEGDLWKKVAQAIGKSILFESLKLKTPPTDPTLN